MNGIKMSDCKFYVNEDERTVVCVIPNTRDMLTDFICENFSWNDIDMDDAIGWGFSDSLSLPNSFIGKAVCAPEDEWSKETGCLIAFARAKDKCYKSFFKRANKFIQTVDKRLNDMIEMFNDFGMKLENRRETLQDEINDRVSHEGE